MVGNVADKVEVGRSIEVVNSPSGANASRRRFVVAATIGMTIAAIPYLWVQFVLWNGAPNLLRNSYPNGYGGGFYDLQARAMLAGHLYVPRGSLAIESWIHNGHAYTYFGLFPSLLRVPILVVTHRLDGQLTALSLLLAWLLTGLFASMLVWRIRVMIRGEVALGLPEAVTMGTLVATVVGGSVLVYLGANPYVYSEDKAWSVTLALGSLFALLGVLERPSWSRVTAAGLLVVAANLTRVTEGYACVIGALLVALWFALGRRGAGLRSWWMPMVAIAVIAVAVGSAVNWAKFGMLFGLPVNDYTAFHVLNEKAINGGHYFDFIYLPSTLLAYLQPGGLRLTSLFPFITLPAGPPRAVGGVLFDNRARTASVTASMPLLFLLSCLGVVHTFRRHPSDVAKMLRILLIASATGTGAVLFYGWIANRYLADFLPFLILASGIGAVVVYCKLEARSTRVRLAATGIVVAVGAFSIAANVALSITPTDAWSSSQASRFLQAQNSLSNLTGHPLAGQIVRGNSLPYWAPADTVFIARNCDALYVSNGEDYRGVLNQRAEHRAWVVVEEGQGYEHILRVTFGTPNTDSRLGVPLVTIGNSAILVHSTDAGGGYESVWFTVRDPYFASTSIIATIARGTTHAIVVDTDLYAKLVSLSMDFSLYVSGPITTKGIPTVQLGSKGAGSPFAIQQIRAPAPSTPLCRALSTLR